MKPSQSSLIGIRCILLFLLILAHSPLIWACSGYKITLGNKTIFGSNHDAWNTSPQIWFENGKDGKYGSAFTGSRYDGENGYAPQSGMNEKGLAFERLAAYHPAKEKNSNRKAIINPTVYLKEILHSCKTVEEVKDFISHYDHSYFIEDLFIYIDKSGKYLIVEPYSLSIGKDPNYVFSNFCPSITTAAEANNIDRYRKGLAFLKNGVDTSLQFYASLLDTMHVCRKKIGDGTLLSSIWDLSEGTMNLYFYHDFTQTVQFNLADELKKGDHRIAVETIFPNNEEFEKLRQFKTPKNSLSIALFIICAGLFFMASALYLLIYLLKRKVDQPYRNVFMAWVTLNLILTYYMLVLGGSVSVFYFDAPYKDPTNVLISMSSYLPYLLLFVMPLLLYTNTKLLKRKVLNPLGRVIFTLNNLLYLFLIGLFTYWKFYTFLD